ncbi:hypothetical protein KBF61_04500 [Candidatus Saccharibacteria bacterium]|nr:hypothetical protein [Candidatus Saccharibacteria bacterium]
MNTPESIELTQPALVEANFAPTTETPESLGGQETIDNTTAQILAVSGLVRQLGPKFTEEDVTDALGANFGLAA